MKVLCSETAIDLWIDGTNRQNIRYDLKRDFRCLPGNFSPTREESIIQALIEDYNLKPAIHMVIGNKNESRKGMPFIQHTIPKNIPPASFLRLSGDLYIACPELCLLQVANDLPMHQLVFLINQLCGTYYIDKCSPFLQQNREPVTSIAQIRTYLTLSKGSEGVKALTRALQYAVDGCNSIMESAIATIMCLPFSYGGYNIPKPYVNAPMPLTESAEKLLDGKICIPDFRWETPKKIVLEYDSNVSHLTPIQHAKDKRRYDAMGILGYRVMTLVHDQLRNQSSIDNFFIELRNSLGLRTRRQFCDKNYAIRGKVIRDLFYVLRLI